MQWHWSKKIRWKAVVILVLSIQPMRCGLPMTDSEAARFPPAIMMAEGYTTQGYPYLFGGISSDERDAMLRRAKDFNVKLVFATKSEAYVSGVSVTIVNAKSAEILKLVTEGPWFYIHLPPEMYSIKAAFQGQTRQVTGLRVSGDKTVERSFIWDLGETMER